jgi:signal transduction histidine kinase
MDTQSRASVHIEVTSPLEGLSLTDEMALAIFRITQEALRNAIRHADASEVAVRLTMADNGRGISRSIDSARFVAQGHFGLAGMRERAAMIGGKLEIRTAVDYGTAVILELPR